MVLEATVVDFVVVVVVVNIVVEDLIFVVVHINFRSGLVLLLYDCYCGCCSLFVLVHDKECIPAGNREENNILRV